MKEPKYDLCIFDLDGTLLDTLNDLADAVNAALVGMGYPERTFEEIKSFVGNGAVRLIKQALPDEKRESEELCAEGLRLFKEHYENNLTVKTVPYDGIREMLEEVKKSGMKTAVLSNKDDAPTRALCEHFFPEMFGAVMGRREDIERKPSPQGIFFIAETFGVSAERTVLIGDSETDALTAKNAGVAFIGAEWGFRGREALKKNGADITAETAKDVLRLL